MMTSRGSQNTGLTQKDRARILVGMLALLHCCATATGAEIDDAADLFTQQQQEKLELQEMKQEIDHIKRNMRDALSGMQQLGKTVEAQQKLREFHLVCKESSWELAPGVSATAFTYNGQMPGPVMRLMEGDHVRISLKNELKTPTSLYFHGMPLPQSVNGLPRRGAGLVGPGQTQVYDFVASQPGTFWYHPQIVHGDQVTRGLAGAIVVEPRSVPKTYENDLVLVITEWAVPPPPGHPPSPTPARPRPLNPVAVRTLPGPQVASPPPVIMFLVNGKSAPAIPPIEVRRGERVRLRVINSSQEACPLSLTGHRFEVVAQNGSDSIEPHVGRDTVTVNPGERMDLEFTADNPGVWSLNSMLHHQSSYQGRFPGGIAVVVRYPEPAKTPSWKQ